MTQVNSLGTRMKRYEFVPRYHLTRRNPVIIRVDGKAFHTFTKGLKKPFDGVLLATMQETAKALCEKIQGCKLAYVQSDEISLLLIDYENIDTCAWFDYNIQKMASISASIATLAFNKAFREQVHIIGHVTKDINYFETLESKVDSAMFDSRVFSLPKEEVNNYFLWRQQDATRNSIQMVGQANFSHKELQNKNCNMIQEMLFVEKGINWNNLPTYEKRGACVIKKQVQVGESIRNKWVIDKNIPVFSSDRQYIEQYVYPIHVIRRSENVEL